MTGPVRRLAAVGAVVFLAACSADLEGTERSSDSAPIVSSKFMTPPADAGLSGTSVNSATAPTTAPMEQAPTGGGVINPTQAGPEPSYEFTLALAGDVNFVEQTAELLAAGPATALREAADQLSAADLTMVNLETAITEGGSPAPKQFHFRAPATALDALDAAGVDVATMANNHAVDYGDEGLRDSLAAIANSPIPVLGIGANAKRAYAPWITTVNGVRVGLLAASQVHDWTIAAHTAGPGKPGIASAFDDRLVKATKKLAKQVDVVVVYLHWGVEFDKCPSGEQRTMADKLAAAGATAIVGTHAHLLQGAGWRDDGVYVAYGLGNYYWWRSFGNTQDDNGVLTLTFRNGRVAEADFLATRLDERGVPQVVAGQQRERIEAQWEADRRCAGLAKKAPRS